MISKWVVSIVISRRNLARFTIVCKWVKLSYSTHLQTIKKPEEVPPHSLSNNCALYLNYTYLVLVRRKIFKACTLTQGTGKLPL